MGNRRIHVGSYPAAATAGAGKAPLFFVHGGYVNSACWEFQFIPFFRSRGYDCYAIDLRGHGASEGQERLNDFGIDDYAEDVARALRTIGQPAVLVGHSMGSLVIQRYLERREAEALAAVFLAPVPATGTAGSAMQLALRYPGFFQALDAAVSGRITEETTELMARIYFSPGVTGGEILRFLPMVGAESEKAVAEMALLPTRPPARHLKVPALVMGGEEDAVFPASSLFFTALPWQADIHRLPGAGHMFLIDHHWRKAADRVLEWLATKVVEVV